MSFYEYYATRQKHPLGVLIHQRQAYKMFDILKRFREPKGGLLEIGPGDGYFANECIKAKVNYVAIDANSIFAHHAKEKGVIAIQASVPPIPIQSNVMQACCLSHVIEHMDSPKQARLLKQVIIWFSP